MRLKQADIHPLSVVQHNGNENLLSDSTTTTTSSTEQYTANNRNNLQLYNNQQQQQQLNNLHNVVVLSNGTADSVRRRQDTLQWCNTINTIQHQQLDTLASLGVTTESVVGDRTARANTKQLPQQLQHQVQQPRSGFNINNTLAASLPIANSRCDESSPDDSLLDYEEAQQSCSSVDTSPQDEDRGFDLSDSESLSDDLNISGENHHVQTRGIVNPNYPGFQHLAHTLDYTIKACSDTDFTDDDLDIDTNDVNNINNNNNNDDVEYKIDSVNRLDSVENIQKEFYDKPILNIPLEFDSEKRNNIVLAEEASNSAASDEDLEGNLLQNSDQGCAGNKLNITESISSADIIGDLGKEIECELGKLIAREIEQELEEAVEKLTVANDLSPSALKYNIEPNSDEPFEKVGPVVVETVQVLQPLVVTQELTTPNASKEQKDFVDSLNEFTETVQICEPLATKEFEGKTVAFNHENGFPVLEPLVATQEDVQDKDKGLESIVVKQEVSSSITTKEEIGETYVVESLKVNHDNGLSESMVTSSPIVSQEDFKNKDIVESLNKETVPALESMVMPSPIATKEEIEDKYFVDSLKLNNEDGFTSVEAIKDDLTEQISENVMLEPELKQSEEFVNEELNKKDIVESSKDGFTEDVMLEPLLVQQIQIKKSVQFVEKEEGFVGFRPELVKEMADIKVAKVTSTEALTLKLNQSFSQPKDLMKMKPDTKTKTADAFLSEVKDDLPEFVSIDVKPKPPNEVEEKTRKVRRDSNRETEDQKDTKMETDAFERYCKELKTKNDVEKDEDSTVPRKKEKMEIHYVKKRRDSSQQIASLITIPRRELGGRNLANRRSVPAAREKKKASPEVLGGFDVYNIETAMPKIDLDAIESHLRAAREEERRRRTDREEIRRRLAMGSEDDYYNGCDRPGRKPSLQARLQSGMNLQICFMNETASDTESPNSDTECSLAEPKHSSLPMKPHHHKMQLRENKPSLQPRPVSLPLGTTQPLLQPVTQPMTEADFFARQARLQTEARMALAQAKEMAHMQMEVERQRQKKSPITEMIRSSLEKVGIPFPEERRRVSRQILTEMNVAQLQVIVNDLHTQIETLNENLVRYLMNRDDLHMEQDSMLVDIEDLTRYLGAKEQTVKDQKLSSQNNNIPPPSPAPASPLSGLSAINNSVKPRLHRIASLVKK